MKVTYLARRYIISNIEFVFIGPISLSHREPIAYVVCVRPHILTIWYRRLVIAYANDDYDQEDDETN